ncbi:hypothetical protein BV898_15054 [Hypsibius exemplaris]|uniref:Uncharacterized protein n=1 Tax=Hypsibius exemplaris TaxID=2072580 RepID=A0A9X6RKC2_HYPEX|nr:hypothetical protein BV898_15054 [Hypsibius exemplaris]
MTSSSAKYKNDHPAPEEEKSPSAETSPMVKLASDPIQMACLFLQELMRTIVKYPELTVEMIAPTDSVNILDLFCLIRKNVPLPHAKAVMQRFNGLSETDQRLVDWMDEASDDILNSVGECAKHFFGSEAIIPYAKMPAFFSGKQDNLKQLRMRAVEATTAHNNIIEQVDRLTKLTGDALEEILLTRRYRGETGIPKTAFDVALSRCKNIQQGDLKKLHHHWKLKYYTKEKIVECEKQYIDLHRKKDELLAQLLVLKRKKLAYQSLGPEFQFVVRSYGQLRRDIEVANRILNSGGLYSP